MRDTAALTEGRGDEAEDAETESENDDDASGDGVQAQSGWERDPACDLDAFVGMKRRKPRNWESVVSQSEAIVIDEMHTLLDMHYDELHKRDWLAKHPAGEPDDAEKKKKKKDKKKDKKRKRERCAPPKRPSGSIVYNTVLEHKLRRKYDLLDLPANVKEILRSPSDEQDDAWIPMTAFPTV